MPGESLVTTLGFDAQQAIETLKRLELRLNKYTKAMRKAATATKAYNKMATGVEKSLKASASGAKAATTATKEQSTALEKSGKQIKEADKSLKKLGDQSKKTGQQMVLTWQSVIRIFTIQVIHQMISKMTSSLGGATKAASDLEIQLAEIQTIGVPLRGDLEGLADKVQELSDTFGIQAEIVAEGIYETLSNQVAGARDAFTFFATAADFSVAAVTSADSAVNLLSSTINAFGFNASQATLLGAKLFRTIDLGRIRGEEFADTFGRIAVLAARLGISLDETLTAIATLTIAGLKYNEAFTLINNVMLKLIRPTEALQNVFDSLGIQTVEAGIQAYGFQGLLGKLAETTGDTATEMGELFGRVRAVRGALGLTGKAAKKYASNLKAIREAGPETLFEAKKIIFETNAKQVQIEIEQLRNAIVFDFGRKSLAVTNRIIKAFGGLKNMVYTIGLGVGVAAAGFAVLAAATFPLTAGIVALGLAVTALAAFWNELSKTGQERIQERLDAHKKAIIEINAAEAKAAEDRITLFSGEFAVLQKALVERLAAVHRIKQQAIMVEELISSHLNQQLDNRKMAFNRFVQSLIKSMDQAKNNINKAQNDIFALQRKLSQEIFEGQTGSYNEAQKAQAMLQRSTEISRRGAQEFKKGHRERATLLFSESAALAEQAKTIGQNINNLSIERSARNTIQQIIKNQIRAQRQFAQIEQQRGKSLAEQIPLESARARRIAAIIEKLKEFELFGKKGEVIFPTKEAAMAAIKPLLVALQNELTAAGAKVNIFKRLQETGKTDLQDALQDILKPMEDIFSAQKIDLFFAYEDRIGIMFKDIQNVADQLPIEIKLKLEKLGFDPATLKGIEDASKGLVKVFQSIQDSIRATADLKGQQEILKTQLGAVEETARAVSLTFQDQVGIGEQINMLWDNRVDLVKRVWTLSTDTDNLQRQGTESLGKQQQVYEQINDALTRAQSLVEGTFDPERFKSAMASLEGAAIAQEKLGNVRLAENVRVLIERLKEAGETAIHVSAKIRGTEIQFGTEELQKMEDMLIRQGELGQQTTSSFQNLGVAATVAANTGNTAFSTMQSGLVSLQHQAHETARAISGIVSGATIPAHFGRMIYRQYGGYTPQSTDTVPAMLSPGEFVVNARSARRFQSQLMAMNSGIQPVFRRSGGSSTTIGDVNITVQESSSPKQTAREMMFAFRREVRRNTSLKP